MPVPIVPVSHLIASPQIASPILSPQPIATGGSEFQSVFSDALHKVESFQNNAQQSVDRFLNGEGEEIHKVALATQQADLSFQMFLQVRNKVVSAYQEIMRMQV
jgi:flagellar hook-basal body complex protein FliE